MLALYLSNGRIVNLSENDINFEALRKLLPEMMELVFQLHGAVSELIAIGDTEENAESIEMLIECCNKQMLAIGIDPDGYNHIREGISKYEIALAIAYDTINIFDRFTYIALEPTLINTFSDYQEMKEEGYEIPDECLDECDCGDDCCCHHNCPDENGNEISDEEQAMVDDLIRGISAQYSNSNQEENN